MPLGDKTGPTGLGPKTGRAVGYCSGSTTPGYMNTGVQGRGRARGMGAGRGMAFGGGFGRGFGGGRRGRGNYGRGYYQTPPPQNFSNEFSEENERNYLENLLRENEQNISEIKKRLESITKNDNNKK